MCGVLGVLWCPLIWSVILKAACCITKRVKRCPLGILYRINKTSPSNGQCHVDLSMAHACMCVCACASACVCCCGVWCLCVCGACVVCVVCGV